MITVNKCLLQMLIVYAICIIYACNTREATPADNPAGMSDRVYHGYNELADSTNREALTISDYNADNPDIKNIERPVGSTVNTELDTTLLFAVWVSDPEAPHADFELSARSFLVADYDGDGEMPYELTGNQIKIYYNDFVQYGEIISVDKDTLKILWKDFSYVSNYVRWKN